MAPSPVNLLKALKFFVAPVFSHSLSCDRELIMLSGVIVRMSCFRFVIYIWFLKNLIKLQQNCSMEQ